MSHTFPKGDIRRVGTYEACALCERTHDGYTVSSRFELGWCDDHQDDVEVLFDALVIAWSVCRGLNPAWRV